MASGKSNRRFFKDAANGSPSPGGEGRGEDGRCNKFLSLLTGLTCFGSLHGLTQQQPVWFFLDKIFAGRKVKIVKRKTHTPVPRAKPAATPAQK